MVCWFEEHALQAPRGSNQAVPTVRYPSSTRQVITHLSQTQSQSHSLTHSLTASVTVSLSDSLTVTPTLTVND